MKLIRYGEPGAERPGLLLADGRRVSCADLVQDWNLALGGLNVLEPVRALDQTRLAALPEVPAEARWGAPVARPGKIICIGLNYVDHARESAMALPGEPIIFMKAPNCVIGPYDQLVIPRNSQKTDWEVELGVIIGDHARYLASPDSALAHVFGYCVTHDVSEREFQLERGGQWDKGKSCDTFNPLGPWLLTADQLADPGVLDLYLRVNGEIMQAGNTASMIFNVPYLIYYVSQFMTLEPGDLISTGTPPGVGLGRNPPQFLKAGDVVELGVTGLGAQRQVCIDYDSTQG